jgi:toxin secretion/phage lysis holin
MVEEQIKMDIAVTMATLLTYLRVLLIPLVLVGIVMFLDFLSGFVAVVISKEQTYKLGIVGIAKKTGQCAIIVVGVIIDITVQYITLRMDIDIGEFHYVALFVCIWLILNECISILDNVGRVGVKHPTFIKKLLIRMRGTVEQKGNELSNKHDD